MTTQAFAVLTAIGPDRVGIVDDLSRLIASLGGNIEESKMAILGGEFAVIMLISMAAPRLEALEGVLANEQKALGLRLELKPTRKPEAKQDGRPYILETVSLDTAGIVLSVTAVLKAHGINIEELETLTQPAPWTGAPMFRMRATIILGPAVSILHLRADLAQLEAERDLDITLRPAVVGQID
jgi:glycine cleavage system transcriptional repressor